MHALWLPEGRTAKLQNMERKMFLKADRLIFQKAEALLNNMTHAELLLWGYMKQKPLGYKFRRQHPINKYIVDFYCHALRFAIEVDGDVHSDPDTAHNDAERQSYLEQNGLEFFRFTNRQIYTSLETVINKIEKYITNHPNHIGKPL